jgi:hypothetical protein
MPKAMNAAERSSAMTLVFILAFLAKAKVRAALLEPGQIMASFMPCKAHNSTILYKGSIKGIFNTIFYKVKLLWHLEHNI